MELFIYNVLVLLVVGFFWMLYIFVRLIARKKYYRELVEKFDEKLSSQVNDTLNKRIDLVLQTVDNVRRNKKAILDKRPEKTKEFDINTSVVNGGDMFVELRMLSVRYSNESVKDKRTDYII